MHVILIFVQLEEVDYFKYLGWQVATDGGLEKELEWRAEKECRALVYM